MRILVVGSGGREHALAWKLSQEAEVICAPGNPGIGQDVECIKVPVHDVEGLISLAKSRDVDLVVVGPEDPLVNGLADHMRAAGLAVYGPGAKGAELEASKAFSKEIMREAKVPTAEFRTFTIHSEAKRYVDEQYGQGRQLAIKASGNALGKGVVVASEREMAQEALVRMMVEREFGPAGETVVLEECLPGPEFSVLTLVGDHNVVSLPVAQDHKRAFDGDRGPNTGGMGSFSPVPWVNDDLVRQVEDSVVMPAIKALRKRGIEYRGTLFSGMMMDGAVAKCLEYNVRFGDPETQSVMLRLGTGFAKALHQCAIGEWIAPPTVLPNAAISVVVACQGYPTSPRKGDPITILPIPAGAKIFHAGTALQDAKLVTSGGRVASVSASAASLAEAKKIVYAAVDAVQFDGAFHRRDIGASG